MKTLALAAAGSLLALWASTANAATVVALTGDNTLVTVDTETKAATGTQTVSGVEGKLLGNRDLLLEGLEKFKNGYMGRCFHSLKQLSIPLTSSCVVGEGLWDKVDANGHLHSIEILWNWMYMTDDANVLKVRRLVALSFTRADC